MIRTRPQTYSRASAYESAYLYIAQLGSFINKRVHLATCNWHGFAPATFANKLKEGDQRGQTERYHQGSETCDRKRNHSSDRRKPGHRENLDRRFAWILREAGSTWQGRLDRQEKSVDAEGL